MHVWIGGHDGGDLEVPAELRTDRADRFAVLILRDVPGAPSPRQNLERWGHFAATRKWISDNAGSLVQMMAIFSNDESASRGVQFMSTSANPPAQPHAWRDC